MIVVSDTSAISALLKIGCVDLLSSIYGKVFIPEAVKRELLVVHSEIPGFISTHTIADRAFFSRLHREIDEGEAEAIVLAKELGADELLIDETAGRLVAMREGIHVIGLLGIILESKLRGLLPSARKTIEQLENKTSFYVAVRLKEAILREANEL
ncbi:MAG TPA: DUF3368 domain-containing protein [Verrucomicrobiae bacterium]|jgi:hypothetical protein|nr:DUF3368 domain-containing protein [Verrucomicrobiae bacterium]